MAGIPKPGTVSTKQARIAQLARQIRSEPLHSLSHHVDLDWLREAYQRTRKDGAVGIDGRTSGSYASELDAHLESLLHRAKTGLYRAPPVRRVYIPKGDGKRRPLGIPTFEDKVLQRAVVMALQPVYETEFYDFSYGFRPGRSAHDAVAHLREVLMAFRGGWVLDVDIQDFFGTLVHGQLRDLLRRRVTDGVVVRLVGKWLRAGVLEDGAVRRLDTGTPQGGVISPLLSNIYLHEVLDRWWVEEVQPRMRGRTALVRYADDFVLVFTDPQDAERVHRVLSKRFERFGLTLHPEKTRLVPFHHPWSWRSGGDPSPGSFDFLGFTHYWCRSRRGYWVVKRRTAKRRFSRAVRRLDAWMRTHHHVPIAVQAKALRRKLRGHFNYYGIQGNGVALWRFAYEARTRWWKWLSRRSQRARLTWPQFFRIFKKARLPKPRVKPRGTQLRLANL